MAKMIFEIESKEDAVQVISLLTAFVGDVKKPEINTGDSKKTTTVKEKTEVKDEKPKETKVEEKKSTTKTKVEKEEKQEPEDEVETETKVTLDDLKELGKKAVAGCGDREKVKSLIGEYGANLSKVEVSDYDELADKLTELAEGK